MVRLKGRTQIQCRFPVPPPKFSPPCPGLDSPQSACGDPPPGANRLGKPRRVHATNIQLRPQPGERRRRLTQPLCSFQASSVPSSLPRFPAPTQPGAVPLGGQRWSVLSLAPTGALSGRSSVTPQMARRAEPPDGGWGWMVVLSAFFQSALVFGVLRSFGIFFVEFVEAFEEQAARVSWIASIGIAVQQLGSECCAWVWCPKTLGKEGEYRDSKRGGWGVGEMLEKDARGLLTELLPLPQAQWAVP